MPQRIHPLLKRLRTYCAAFPEATEVEAWGHPTFRAGKKIYASFGFMDKGDHAGDACITVKSTHPDQALLVADPRFFVPSYVGHKGWVGIRAEHVEWTTVEDLVERSYRMVALKRMVKALDEARG